MLRRLTIVAALLAVTGLAFAVLAPAAASAEEGRRGDVFLRGRGVLDAQGDGLAAVRGRVDYDVTADAGVLLVKDVGGGADIEVSGYGDTGEWLGWTVYFGFEGEAHIIGGDVAIIVLGRNIDLHAAGNGWAYLKGQGTFEVNGRGPFRWTADGTFAGFAP